MSPDAAAADIRAQILGLPRPHTPAIRAVRKERSAELAAAPAAEVVAIARALELASPQETKWVAYELIRFHKGAFAALDEVGVAEFAGRLASWYATDAFGTILSGPLWAKGRVSDALIQDWSRSDDRWLRRSALVATVGRNGRGAGPPDPARTLAICRTLAGDRDDMVQKALSWALRFLAQRGHSTAVGAFLAEMGEALPARVRREVAHKLTTGRKAPRKRAAVTVD
jgi:3-methyladenine DNA glycosylase AlkD